MTDEQTPALDPTDVPAVRRQKVQAMRDAGVDPYPPDAERTHSAAEALAMTEGEVTVCGRVGPIRVMGKSAFFHIEDASGRIQVYMKRNTLGDEQWQAFRDWLELSDFAQVTGSLFDTRTGERTIAAQSWRLLSKTIRPLPKEHFGLKDHQTRLRRRHVDLAINPEVREVFLQRSRIISAMRRWLEDPGHEFGGYVEIESPMMHAVAGGALARPFQTHHNALGLDLSLRIALELHHKRCVVGGIERVYEIGRIFRNEGISTRHNPEFTMMELYTAFVDVRYTERLTEALIRHLAREVCGSLTVTQGEQTIDLGGEWRRVAMCELIAERCGESVHPGMSSSDLRARLGAMVEDDENPLPEEPGHLLLEVFERHIEQTLIAPTFVTDFPKSVSPLVKVHRDDPLLAERTELYIGGLELAPMYTELNDPDEQRRRFEEQMRARESGDDEAMRMDTDFLEALESGMPPTSGVGLGIDRLVMLLTGQASIRDVILFPLLRPESPAAD